MAYYPLICVVYANRIPSRWKAGGELFGSRMAVG